VRLTADVAASEEALLHSPYARQPVFNIAKLVEQITTMLSQFKVGS
jgi:hypothetical protein